MSTDCGEEMQPTSMLGTAVKANIRDGLACKQNRLKTQLAEVEAAIAALDANPEIAKVLELVGKASRH